MMNIYWPGMKDEVVTSNWSSDVLAKRISFPNKSYICKTLLDKIGLGVQVRYEQVERMKINESVFLFGRPSNYYPEATGYKKVFITPQVSLAVGRFSAFASYDFPIYQYLNTSLYYTQAASDFQATLGVSYKFTILQDPNSLQINWVPVFVR